MKKKEIKTIIEELTEIPQEIATKLQDRSDKFAKELQDKIALTAEHILKTSLIDYIDDCIKIFKDAKKKVIKVNTTEDYFVETVNKILKDLGIVAQKIEEDD